MSVRSPIANLGEGKRTLTADASHHLCRVLRLRAGDRFVAFDPEAHVEADATIDEVAGSSAVVTIGAPRSAGVVATLPIALVYALAKGDKVDTVVRDATELGATRIFVARTERAVAKAAGEDATKKVARWRRIAEQAARQSGRADPPNIEGVLPWREALEAAAECSVARYCLWENATHPLGTSLPARVAEGSALSFAIGPEGGLSEREVEEARALGFESVSLGRFILRTETVAAAVLGAVRILATG